MLVGLRFFHTINMDMGLILVMLVGLGTGLYIYTILKDAKKVYVGVLGSIILTAFCELLSVISFMSAPSMLLQIIAIVAPLIEHFLLPLAIGLLAAMAIDYIRDKIKICQL